jgi:hypothetical protein
MKSFREFQDKVSWINISGKENSSEDLLENPR